jgi:hypothetical protein
MKQEIVLKHEFVEFIPDELAQGTIYISIRFATASHLCCCGCGSKVVTPIRPTDWKLIFDGKTVSLYPSIGNWSFACKSHYWIRNNRAKWAPRWSRKEIDRGRNRDRKAKGKYFDASEVTTDNFTQDSAEKLVTGKPE